MLRAKRARLSLLCAVMGNPEGINPWLIDTDDCEIRFAPRKKPWFLRQFPCKDQQAMVKRMNSGGNRQIGAGFSPMFGPMSGAKMQEANNLMCILLGFRVCIRHLPKADLSRERTHGLSNLGPGGLGEKYCETPIHIRTATLRQPDEKSFGRGGKESEKHFERDNLSNQAGQQGG